MACLGFYLPPEGGLVALVGDEVVVAGVVAKYSIIRCKNLV